MADRAVRRHVTKSRVSGQAGVALLALIAVALAGPSCRTSPKSIPIGAFAPLSGELESFGESTKNGIELAVKEVNSAGGVGGKLLELSFIDDQGDPEEAVAAVRRLIENVGVAVILGGATSGNSLAAGPICQSAGVPMVSPSSTNPQVTKVGDFIFRVCYVDSFQGTAMATFAYNSLRIRDVAIMSKSGDGYSEVLAEFFADMFSELGGDVVAEVEVPGSSAWLSSSVRLALDADPEAIFLPLYYQDVSEVCRKVAESGVVVRLLGGDGWDSPELLRLAGEVLEDAYFTTHFSPEDRRARVRTFLRTYRENYDATPDAIAALGYDAAHLVADALGRLNDEEPRAFEVLSWAGRDGGGERGHAEARMKLRDAISTTTGFDGVTGEITIDRSRNALKPAVVLRIEDGGVHYAGVVRP